VTERMNKQLWHEALSQSLSALLGIRLPAGATESENCREKLLGKDC
jgi:hypothetical protein